MDPGSHPAYLIELPIESAPRVFVRAASGDEEVRLIDWLRTQDELAELVERALIIAQEARAA